jgi:hypothetical protein
VSEWYQPVDLDRALFAAGAVQATSSKAGMMMEVVRFRHRLAGWIRCPDGFGGRVVGIATRAAPALTARLDLPPDIEATATRLDARRLDDRHADATTARRSLRAVVAHRTRENWCRRQYTSSILQKPLTFENTIVLARDRRIEN